MKKILLIVLAVVLTLTLLLTSLTFAYPSHKTIEYVGWGMRVSNWLDMEYYRYVGSYKSCSGSACGPSAGVSIGRYYREDPDKDYGNLPDDDDMYEVLYDEFPTFGCFTEPFYYGYGFVEMTQDPDQNNNTNDGYYNFGYVYAVVNTDNSDDIFDDIVNAIDNGWPIALSGYFGDSYISKDGPGTWPPTKGHYIAIKGYSYCQNFWPPGQAPYDFRIRCTDSLSRSNSLWLDWDTAVEEGINLEINIIKDEIPEDFEWGSHGDPLSDDGGDVNWTVTADGDSYAEISILGEHSGSKCGKFYYDGDPDGYNYVRGYYSEDEPIWRGFWLKTDGDAVPTTRTGNGQYSILVRVASDGTLQYYDGRWKDTPHCSLDSNTWYFIEFRAIKWDTTHKYDIYVDGTYELGGVPMYPTTSYNGKTAYYSQHEGSFRIDDISSSCW